MAYHGASRLMTAATAEALRGIGAEVEGGRVVLYRGTDIPDQTAADLRYGDFLSSVAGGADATGNLGASSYGKYVHRFELPVGDIRITNGELQYKGKSRSLQGGGRYPEAIYRAYNDAMGSNYTGEEIDGMPEDEVRSVARMALEGGGEEFDQLAGRAAWATIRTMLAKKRERAARTTSGLYRKSLEPAITNLRDRLLHFATLLLHRIVEERRFAVILSELELGNKVYMTREPSREDPEEELEGRDIALWTAQDALRVQRMYNERVAKTANLGQDLARMTRAAEGVEEWLETAIPIFADHMDHLDGISADQADAARKKEDRDPSLVDGDFKPRAPSMKWKRRDLFADRPEANDWSLRHWSNIYKHGTEPGQLTPMSMRRDNHAAAALLDRRMTELRSKSWEVWARDVSDDGDVGFLDAVENLLAAANAAYERDAALVANEWERVDEMAHGPLKVTGAVKKRKRKRKKRDWDRFKFRERHTPQERLDTEKRNYKRDKLGRFTK